MDRQYRAQDVIRCELCQTCVSPMYCDICQINLCKACVGEHLSDGSKEHKVVPFEQRECTSKCPKHFTKICELYCKYCCMPICMLCVASGEHDQHKKEDISQILIERKEILQKDLQELENSIIPNYQKAASNIPVQKADMRKHFQKLTTALKKQEETLHKEIAIIVQQMQSLIDAMDSKNLAAIEKREAAINQTIAEIEQNMADIKLMLDSDNFYFVSAYKSKNEKFRELPAHIQVTLPKFTPQKINREQLHQQFGSLTKTSYMTEENDDSVKTTDDGSSSPVTIEDDRGPRIPPGVAPSPPARPARAINYEPRVLMEIHTDYGLSNALSSVSTLSDSMLWTGGTDKTMRLYNLHGELLKSVPTKSGNAPQDLAVTESEDLVYTDPKDRSINLVKKKKIKLLIRLQGWIPLQVCFASCGDFLVSMTSDDNKETKVVRYSGSAEKQIFQWDEQGEPLYTSAPKNDTKFLSENRNLDVCVADRGTGAVVVVNSEGKLRFRYTGPVSDTKKFFNPTGLVTDSQGRILTADHWNNCVHILDQDGHFLRYIDNCRLHGPCGLCLDSKDNLFVAEYYTGKVKKIKYLK